MNYKVKPWKHQLEAIGKAKDLPGYALFFEQGTGKTSTTINILRHKMNERKQLLRILIFCPPIVCKNWKDEWLMHSDVNRSNITILSGSGKERIEEFLGKAFVDKYERPHIFITNYESLLMPELFKAFQEWRPEAIVFDESHRLKAHDSKRSKAAAILANPGDDVHPLKYILSGSPVLNSPLDVFQQFKILDGGRTFRDNFFSFRTRYFHDANVRWKGTSTKYFPKWVVRPGAVDEINEKIFRTGMRVEKKDCLDLPPLVRQVISVPMTTEQARVYKDLAKQYVAFVDGGAVSAQLAIVKALRLMQLASGFVALDGSEEKLKVFPKNPKIEALRELLEDLTPHSKVLVWAVWKENYKQIRELCEELKIGLVEVHGEISPKGKEEAVERFYSDSSVRVFLGHPGSGGIGINLVNAPYSIFYSRTFSLEHSLQAEARNHRGGSEIHDKITRIDLVSEGTIDEEVVKRLHQKEELSGALLKNLVQTSLVR
jgi:SNF2 family DNA or RNA helicase